MARFSLKQKIFIVKRYYQNGNSTEIVQKEFPNEFQRCKSPTDSVIIDLINLFEKFGNLSKKSVKDKLINSKTVLKPSFPVDSIIADDQSKISANDESKVKYIIKEENEEVLPTTINYAVDPFNIILKQEDTEGIKQINELNLSEENLFTTKNIEHQSVIAITKATGDDEHDSENMDHVKSSNESDSCDSVVFAGKKPPKNLLKCELCNKTFTRNQSYRRHINHHQKTCEICGKHYRDYTKHMQKHTGEKIFQCTTCGDRFANMRNLKSHMSYHSEERPYACEICNKKFKTKENLTGHLKIHSSERPIKCETCGKGFINNSALRKHAIYHTGDKPFICSFCGKAFASSTGLRVHDRIHTGEKPYKCKLCNKEYNNSSSLKIHGRTHTGEKPFKCSHCEKGFYDIGTMRVHERTHTGNYPYKCLLCGKAHNHPSNLKSHMRNAHREEQSQSITFYSVA